LIPSEKNLSGKSAAATPGGTAHNQGAINMRHITVEDRFRPVFGNRRWESMFCPEIHLIYSMSENFYCYKCLAAKAEAVMFSSENRVKRYLEQPLHGRFVRQVAVCGQCGGTRECIKLTGKQGEDLWEDRKGESG
jgi:hypothetical protein